MSSRSSHGYFTARLSLTWKREGQTESQLSQAIGKERDTAVSIPAGSSTIVATIDVMTSHPPKEGWKTAGAVEWSTNGVRRLELSGQVHKPQATVIFDKSVDT